MKPGQLGNVRNRKAMELHHPNHYVILSCTKANRKEHCFLTWVANRDVPFTDAQRHKDTGRGRTQETAKHEKKKLETASVEKKEKMIAGNGKEMERATFSLHASSGFWFLSPRPRLGFSMVTTKTSIAKSASPASLEIITKISLSFSLPNPRTY